MKRTSANRWAFINSPLSLWERVRVRALERKDSSSCFQTSLMPSPPAPLPKGEGRKSNRDRRGAIIVVILVCFAVASALFVLLAGQSVAGRRAADAQLWSEQARWVAEAALERAAARLAVDANYVGETWTIPAAELTDKEAALAKIHVEKDTEQPERRLVRVEADYPDAPVYRSRWSKQITIDLAAPAASKTAETPKKTEKSENMP
jgi:hypothetical protein